MMLSCSCATRHGCPCSHYTDPRRECRCTHWQIESYRRRISGPLLDRIDIHVDVPSVEYREMTSSRPAETSEASLEHQGRDEGATSVNERCNPWMDVHSVIPGWSGPDVA